MNDCLIHIYKCIKFAPFLGVLLIFTFIIGCSHVSNNKESSSIDKKITQIPHIIIQINGDDYVPNLSKRITVDWKKNMTVTDALKQSGIMKLSDEDGTILAVSDVSLDDKMIWGIMINNREFQQLQALEKTLQVKDQITVFVKKIDKKEELPTSKKATTYRHGSK